MSDRGVRYATIHTFQSVYQAIVAGLHAIVTKRETASILARGPSHPVSITIVLKNIKCGDYKVTGKVRFVTKSSMLLTHTSFFWVH
jgi:hypothetical protein